jgi:Lipase maturation factor
MIDELPSYWYSRFVFERAMALVYLIAFLVAANQFVPLLGERGLLPVPRFVRVIPFRAAPSLFYFAATDPAFRAAAWTGVALACLALTGYPQRWGTAAAAAVWAGLWVLYLSFVNVGQTFYGFGWETLLLEAGFLTIFAGGNAVAPNAVSVWLWRWLLFRLMFGAGLIKLRGDACWRDLTCLDYYFETQPMPNPLSWYFHWLPASIHHAGVVFNHVAELVVPFGYFAPQPIAAIAGLVTIAFQSTLIVSGNLSWLNWMTIVLAIPTLDDRWWSWLPLTPPLLHGTPAMHRIAVYALAVCVAVLSVRPALNLLSPNQMMNSSFDPLHLVNTYGAFGSITRTRDEIVIEGTDDPTPTERTIWREYEFRGKPGDLSRRPPQVAPYHLRLDWLMWFAAMSSPDEHAWFSSLLEKLLQGDSQTLSLLKTNPFPAGPPRYLRGRYYTYRFTTPEERRRTGLWWHRDSNGLYFPPVALQAGVARN